MNKSLLLCLIIKSILSKFLQCCRQDDQNDVSEARLESMMKSISQNQTIHDENQRYWNTTREIKKNCNDSVNSLQGDQSETSKTIFTILSKTIDDVYIYLE